MRQEAAASYQLLKFVGVHAGRTRRSAVATASVWTCLNLHSIAKTASHYSLIRATHFLPRGQQDKSPSIVVFLSSILLSPRVFTTANSLHERGLFLSRNRHRLLRGAEADSETVARVGMRDVSYAKPDGTARVARDIEVITTPANRARHRE